MWGMAPGGPVWAEPLGSGVLPPEAPRRVRLTACAAPSPCWPCAPPLSGQTLWPAFAPILKGGEGLRAELHPCPPASPRGAELTPPRRPGVSCGAELNCPSLFSLCCIAPVLAAKVLRGVEVTVGHEQEEGGKWPYAGTAEAIKALGAKHCVKAVTISFVEAAVALALGTLLWPWGLPWAGCLVNQERHFQGHRGAHRDLGRHTCVPVPWPCFQCACWLPAGSGAPQGQRSASGSIGMTFWPGGWELPASVGSELKPQGGVEAVDGRSTGRAGGRGGSWLWWRFPGWCGWEPAWVASEAPDPPAGARVLWAQSLRPGPTTVQVNGWTQTRGTEQHVVPEGAGDNTMTLGVCLEGALVSLEGILGYGRFQAKCSVSPLHRVASLPAAAGGELPGALWSGSRRVEHAVGRTQGQPHHCLVSA